MSMFVSRRRMPFATVLTAVSAFTFSPFVQAAQGDPATDVLVVGSRFPDDPSLVPIGATVITAAQIREAGVSDVNEAIRKVGGVYGRQSLNGSPDYSLDLRGFGSSSDQNMVVMVDGVRLSENELVSPALSAIPIDSVERIEIVRGGNSVLYGEGATGGTIQIITKRATNKLHGTAFAQAGSYGLREGRASIAGGSGTFSADANVDAQHTDNYRANSKSTIKDFSGGVQWAADGARVGLRVDSSRQDNRFPGALTLAQFEADPRQTQTPRDFGSTNNDRYTLSADKQWGALDAAAELSRRNRTSESTFISSFGDYVRRDDGRVNQFSPRLRYLSSSNGIDNELVGGMDFQHWSRLTNAVFAGFPSSEADASQDSRAVYAQDEIKFGKARMVFGTRHEKFDKNFTDPVSFSNTDYDVSQSLNAWEWTGSYTALPGLYLFAKTGHSYRVANVDEDALTPGFNQPLKPQTSHDYEVGTTLGAARDKLTFRLFRHRITDEIYFDPTANSFGGTNTNLPETRRQGAEIDAAAGLSKDFALSVHAQHVSATFEAGANAGREVPLVPSNTATVRLNWLPNNGQSADVGVRWVDSQRYGGDFDNSCNAHIPAFTLLDARYAHRFGGWEFAISGNNLTDRSYFSNAFGACGSGIYPDPGRQLMLSARLDF